MAEAWFQEKSWADALENCDKAIAEDHSYVYARNLRARILKRMDRIKDAIAELLVAIKLNPNYETAHFNLACYYALQYKDTKSTDLFQKAIYYLKESIRVDERNKVDAQKDSDFDGIRDTHEFKNTTGG